MRLLLLTAYFPPEIGSAAHLFYELGSEFVLRGHSVTVLTGYPTYNVEANRLPPLYRRGWWMKEEMNGMTVVRIRTIGLPRQIPVLRGLGQVTLALSIAFSGLFLAPGRQDVTLVYSPPLFLGLTALLLRAFKSAGAVLNVQDLFPQSAIDLGVLRNRLLIRLFREIESYLYKRSDLVTVHSAGNREHVLRAGGDPDRTLVVPNVVDTDAITPGPRVNAFRDRNDIGEREFIVSFAGVIGLSQDVDSIIEAARLLREHKDLIFFIVGDGVEKERLMKRAEGMDNVRFSPMLPKGEYLELLHASDVCLATLRKEVRTPVVPSKILSIMAAGRPVVAGMPMDGDAPKLIREAQCGVCVEPENPQQFAEAVFSFYRDRSAAIQCGRNGRTFVERHFSVRQCTEAYEQLFSKLLEEKK